MRNTRDAYKFSRKSIRERIVKKIQGRGQDTNKIDLMEM
jgi:hypothetical protein